MPERSSAVGRKKSRIREQTIHRTIILASASPRRKDILEAAGLHFTIDKSDHPEEIRTDLTPRSLARHLSRQKAESVAARHTNALIIAADTLIVHRNKVFGKPHTEAGAMKVLSTLNGKTHSVITGLTVIDTKGGRQISRSVTTKVTFRRISRSEMEEYVRSGEPLDKAGGYAIQGLGSKFVRKIEGDYLNVVGLPLNMLLTVLKLLE